MDLEYTYSYPYVSGKNAPGSDDSENIICWDVLDIDISEPNGEWESMALCSPVLEAWGRWEPEIKHSVDIVLGTISGNQERTAQIIDYMTGRMIKVTSNDLFALMRLADMLLIDDLYNYCKDRIVNLPLTKNNFYKVLHACTLYGFEHEQMDIFIRGNLTELCKGTEMYKLDEESVEMLLTDAELSYWPMKNRFEIIKNWCTDNGSPIMFERWFNFLNLSKLDEEYLNNVVKSNSLVQMSDKCLQRVIDHISFKQDKPVPFVFILSDELEGSNVVGVNLEDMHLYRFKFSENIMDTLSVTRTKVTGEILALNRSLQRIYTYDINNDICKGKRIVNRHSRPLNISHIVETNENMIIISTEERTFDYSPRRVSVLYQSKSDNGKILPIEPFMSLAFKVGCACYNQSMIVMSPSTFSMRSKIYCFGLKTHKMTEINLDSKPVGQWETAVKWLLPIHDKVLVITRTSFKFLSIDSATGVYNLEDEMLINITQPLYGNPRYIVLSDFLVELDDKSVILYNKNREQSSFNRLNSCELKTFRISNFNPITCGYVKRTKPLCHFVCPHCDPFAKEKEEAEILKLKKEEEMRLKEEEEMRIRNRSAKISYMFDDDDDDNYYYDSYDGDHWNQREMIWDGSADEFVEAWWQKMETQNGYKINIFVVE